MTSEQVVPAVLGLVERQVRPGSEAPNLVKRLRTRPTGDPYLHMMVHEAADEIERLRAALLLAQRLCNEALPKFNWGASSLDANAIKLLNDVPLAITRALGPNVKLTGPEGRSP